MLLKLYFTFIFTVILFVFISGKVSAQQYVINSPEVNLRKKAATKAVIISKLYAGDTVLLHYCKGNWCKVELRNGKIGFIRPKNMRLAEIFVPKEETHQVEVIDAKKWSFGYLLEVTAKWFCLTSGILFLIILLFYYLK